MHYYQFNIGDYKTHTAHLTPIEDICYRRLLDHYYLHELPLENNIEKLTRLLMLNGYSTEVEQVLNEYFILMDKKWFNRRADAEIIAFKQLKDSKSKAGKASAAKRLSKHETEFNTCSTGVQLNRNQEPETINHNKDIISNDVADCPHIEIIELYAKHLPMLTQVRDWTDKRNRLLKARWREKKERQSLDWWDRFFAYVATSDFLTGKSKDWQADIEWLLNASNIVKVTEGKYENKAAA